MQKHFESGLAFLIVALLSVATGLLMSAKGSSGAGTVFFLAGGIWFLIWIARRRQLSQTERDDLEK